MNEKLQMRNRNAVDFILENKCYEMAFKYSKNSKFLFQINRNRIDFSFGFQLRNLYFEQTFDCCRCHSYQLSVQADMRENT